MKRKLFFCSLFLLFLFTFSLSLFSQNGSVGEIRIVRDVNNGIQFEVYDLSVTGMKGKQIYFGFALAQNGQWVKNTWAATQSQTVGYSPAYWNGKACWFTYPYYELERVSDLTKSFTGTFFIVNTATDDTIATKDIPFNLSSRTDIPPQPDTSHSNYEEDTNDTSYNSGSKTMMDYFAEAKKRLVSFSGNNPLKKDPKIPGEWMCIIAGERSTYSVLIFYMYLAKDGTGLWEKNAFYLMTDGSLQFSNEDYAQYQIQWGVEEHYTEDNEPVTLLRLTFTIDRSSLRLYYAYTDDNLIASITYDEAAQRPGDQTWMWNTKAIFLADWEQNNYKVRDALYEAYKADRECDQLYWDTMFMIEQSNHNMMMNIINNF